MATETGVRAVQGVPHLSTTMPLALFTVLVVAKAETNHPSIDRAVLPMPTLPLRWRMVQRMTRA